MTKFTCKHVYSLVLATVDLIVPQVEESFMFRFVDLSEYQRLCMVFEEYVLIVYDFTVSITISACMAHFMLIILHYHIAPPTVVMCQAYGMISPRMIH